jgi:hypothetical protein
MRKPFTERDLREISELAVNVETAGAFLLGVLQRYRDGHLSERELVQALRHRDYANRLLSLRLAEHIGAWDQHRSNDSAP